MSTVGSDLIDAERQRQIDEENWGEDHDDAHDKGELVTAAAAYLAHASPVWQHAVLEDEDITAIKAEWPWNDEFHPSTKNHPAWKCLVIAGALIAAELDRLHRVGKIPTKALPQKRDTPPDFRSSLSKTAQEYLKEREIRAEFEKRILEEGIELSSPKVGETIALATCPACGANLDLFRGDDDEDYAVSSVTTGESPVIRSLEAKLEQSQETIDNQRTTIKNLQRKLTEVETTELYAKVEEWQNMATRLGNQLRYLEEEKREQERYLRKLESKVTEVWIGFTRWDPYLTATIPCWNPQIVLTSRKEAEKWKEYDPKRRKVESKRLFREAKQPVEWLVRTGSESYAHWYDLTLVCNFVHALNQWIWAVRSSGRPLSQESALLTGAENSIDEAKQAAEKAAEKCL
jgi:hypothetical protein